MQEREHRSERQRGELGRFVREHRRDAELSLRKLAGLSGVSNPYLSQIERGLRLPSAEVLRQLAPALGVAPETLYERAGLCGVPVVSADLVTAIRHAPELSEDQKRTLVRLYESFRSGGEDPVTVDLRPAVAGVGGESSGKDIG